MVLADRPGIARARLHKQLRPLVWVKMFAGEHRDEIFVTKFGWVTVGLDVVGVLGRVFKVHQAWIPGHILADSRVAVGGYRVHTPMRIDAELGMAKPGGGTVLA